MVKPFDHSRYVPCVRWKQGEYQAIMRLTGSAKGAITPLIEIPEIGWDFENGQDAKTVDEHLIKAPARLITKWGHRDFFLDCRLVETEIMGDGSHPIEWIHSRLKALTNHVAHVVRLKTDLKAKATMRNITRSSKYSLALRITLEDFGEGNLKDRVDALIAYFGISPQECHLLFDLGAPRFEPADGFSRMLAAVASQIPYLKDWATFTLLGTAFPSTMGAVKQGAHELPRYEWIIYKAVLSREIRFARTPTFGDYCIAHPDVISSDMRVVKPAASIRYTIDDRWLIIKGRSFRDDRMQVHAFSRSLVASPYYLGESFSLADQHIAKCAEGKVGPGNLSIWRWVGTNHHIEKVVSDLANLSDFAAAV